jgi:WD40 repeat protein
MIIIWAPSSSPLASTYGSDLSPEDLQHEKEYSLEQHSGNASVITLLFRFYSSLDSCTTMQVYDLAWSPTGEYIIAGSSSTDNTARVFAAVDGKCVYEIAEHSHYSMSKVWHRTPSTNISPSRAVTALCMSIAYLLNLAVPSRLMLLVRIRECHRAAVGDIVVLQVHTGDMVHSPQVDYFQLRFK